MKSWMKSAIDSVAMFGYLGYHNDVNIYPNDANNEIISVACVEASSHSAGCHTPLWRQQHGCHWRGAGNCGDVWTWSHHYTTHCITSITSETVTKAAISSELLPDAEGQSWRMMLLCNAFSEPDECWGDKHQCWWWPCGHWCHDHEGWGGCCRGSEEVGGVCRYPNVSCHLVLQRAHVKYSRNALRETPRHWDTRCEIFRSESDTKTRQTVSQPINRELPKNAINLKDSLPSALYVYVHLETISLEDLRYTFYPNI